LDFSLKAGDLMVVVGMVGAGKTTLLHSLMEETVKLKGKIDIQGTMAYVE
jgi:ABC-type multidrug transport system ATPase subunit